MILDLTLSELPWKNQRVNAIKKRTFHLFRGAKKERKRKGAMATPRSALISYFIMNCGPSIINIATDQVEKSRIFVVCTTLFCTYTLDSI